MTKSEARGVKLNAVIGSLVVFLVLIATEIGAFSQITGVGWRICIGVAAFFTLVNLIKDLILIGEARIKTVKVVNGTSD